MLLFLPSLATNVYAFLVQAPIEIDNLLKHGVNNVVLLLEVFLCRTPFVSYHYQVITPLLGELTTDKKLVMAGFEPARFPNSALSCRLNHSATSPCFRSSSEHLNPGIL